MSLPLEGIKVLEFARFMPGPFCSMILADFGAEVIRVEEPPGRAISGRRAEQAKGTEGDVNIPSSMETRYYDAVQRNKKSIALNLKDPKSQKIAHKLAEKCDVVIVEFRPGVAQRLNIGYQVLSRLNPGLVYCDISLYGQTGPYATYPGHDPCALAVAGMLTINGDVDGTPRNIGWSIADISAALHATIGVLLALRARDKTGKGQYIDISMLDSALDFQMFAAALNFRGRKIPLVNRPNPSSGLWKCKDGKWLCTTNLEPHHWANFCRSIGRKDLIPEQRNRNRRQELHDLICDTMLTRTRDEWLNIFWHEDPESQAAPVNELGEAMEDPQVKARDMVIELEHPRLGKVRQLGMSIKLSETPGAFRSHAALPGENTREILEELEYSEEEIGELVSGGAIGVTKVPKIQNA